MGKLAKDGVSELHQLCGRMIHALLYILYMFIHKRKTDQVPTQKNIFEHR